MELIFLGAGGGRFMTIDQHLKTGGFRVHGQAKIHIDPGPGALLLSHQLGLNPLDLDCVVATHCHPDHYTDAEVLIEGMTQHMTRKRGVFIGSESVIKGKGKFGPCISKYHRDNVAKIISLAPGDSCELGDLKLEATPTLHGDPSTFGIKFRSEEGLIGYTNDTEYFDDLPSYFEGARVLIVNNTRPLGMRIKWHLCSDDVIELIKLVKPELAVMVHMGMLFRKHSPEREADRIKTETGVKTVPGYVGLRVNIGKEVKAKRPTKQPTLEAFVQG